MGELRIHNFNSKIKRNAKAEAALHKMTLIVFGERAFEEYTAKLKKEREDRESIDK